MTHHVADKGKSLAICCAEGLISLPAADSGCAALVPAN